MIHLRHYAQCHDVTGIYDYSIIVEILFENEKVGKF